MMKRNNGKNENSGFTVRAIAADSISAAMGTAVMLLGGVIPVFTYCSPLIAALVLTAVLDSFGRKNAWAVWAVTALLALILCQDREAAFFYIFLCWYPVLKPVFDRIRPEWLSFAAKLAAFSVSAGAMYFIACYVLGIDEIAEGFSASPWINAGFLAVMVLCMMLYDRALNGFIVFFRKRLKGRIVRQ